MKNSTFISSFPEKSIPVLSAALSQTVYTTIEKITVFADHFTVEFKSGITIDIEA